MIQFNLLPDVKKEYVKAKRTKRMLLSASLIASGVAIGVTVILFSFVHIAQKKNITDLTNDIESLAADIQSTQDLNNILTVQNQLSILPGLHAGKPETSRVFSYIAAVSPQDVRLSTVDLDMQTSTLRMSGTADSIATVNKFVDNLKAVQYTIVDSEGTTTPPFDQVVTELSGNNEVASFVIDLFFDAVIFDNTRDINMVLNDATVFTTQEAEGDN